MYALTIGKKWETLIKIYKKNIKNQLNTQAFLIFTVKTYSMSNYEMVIILIKWSFKGSRLGLEFEQNLNITKHIVLTQNGFPSCWIQF